MISRSGLSSKDKRKSAFLYSSRQVPTRFVATNGARLQNVVQLNRQKLFRWFGSADFFCKEDFSTKLESILLLLWHPYGECENWPEKIATANKVNVARTHATREHVRRGFPGIPTVFSPGNDWYHWPNLGNRPFGPNCNKSSLNRLSHLSRDGFAETRLNRPRDR